MSVARGRIGIVLRMVFAGLLAVLFVVLSGPDEAPAGATFPNLIFPFPEGQTWHISVGYECDLGGTPPCHPEGQRYSLDFRRGSATEGQPVRAAAAGTVAGYFHNDTFGWQVQIDHADGYRTFYGELQSGVGFLPAGTSVAQGRTIGYAGCSSINCQNSNIHFSLSHSGFQNDVKPEPMCGFTGFQPFQEYTNCFPDADGDGVPDSLDNCGGAAEDLDQYDDQDGCPEAEPDEGIEADFNNDGRVDVAHICCSNYIHTWFSNGDGTYSNAIYSPGELYQVQLGVWRVGDFNADGNADLAHICCSNYVHLWFSNGDGTYNVTQFFPQGGNYDVQLGDWRVADVNGDGRSDLVHLCCPTYVHTWISNGDGTFSTPPFFPPGTYNVQAGTWRAGDVNADGMVDLVHLCCSEYIHTWISNGDGTYNVILYEPPGDGAYPVQTGSIYMADANGDGRSDLFHICCDGYIHTWLSNGDGTYTVTQYVPGSYPGVNRGTWKVADVNDDGSADLVHLCCTISAMYTWLSNGDGSYDVVPFDPPGIYDVNVGSWRVGDANDDGMSDLIHRCCPESWHTWLSNGSGSYNLGLFDPPGGYDVQLGRWLMGDFISDSSAAPTQSPTPTPSPSPSAPATATPSPIPSGQTLTPTPSGRTPSPTATPTATVTAGPTPVSDPDQGDVNCDGTIDETDFTLLMLYAAGLIEGQQPAPCPDIGEPFGDAFWGDVNCDGVVDILDALYVLAHIAGAPLPTPGGCTPVGQAPPD